VIWLRLALAAILAGIALVGAGVWWLQENLAPAALEAEPVLFEVAPGASLKRIVRQLEAAGLVRDARAVELLARHRRLGAALQAGEYRLSAASSPDALLDAIAQGRVATYELVVPEGFTAVMIAERLTTAGLGDADEFLAWVQDPASAAAHGIQGTSLEGYLFPDTYHLPRGLDARATTAVFVGRFEEVWSEIAARAKERGLSKYETVTLASIVEKETGAPQERPLIAAVFLNRMKRGMRLETDPTVIYGIPDFDGNLRRRDLENRENPYNTYVIPGLPPGPIASPGRDALIAVVEPAETEYLFFVSRNDGTHRFSRTYAEHALAVNEFQKRRRSR
jgi:UPF0755 protein